MLHAYHISTNSYFLLSFNKLQNSAMSSVTVDSIFKTYVNMCNSCMYYRNVQLFLVATI